MDDSTYYFSVVFSLALGFLVIRPSGIAFILTVLCRVFLSRYFKHFHLGRISLFPLSIDGLEIVTKPTKRRPEVSIKWESLKLLIDLHKSFDPLLRWLRLLRDPEQPTEQYRRRLVSVEFHQLEVSSPSIRFEDFIAPSPNKMPQPVPTVEGREVMPTTNLVSSMLAAKTLGQHLMMFFDVHFVAFSFDFHIPTTESVLQGSAERMHVTFPSPMNGWIESVGMRMQICEGQMEIVQGGVQAFHYVGHSACMCVDYHVPLGMMDVSMNLYGRQDDLAVAIKPFLEFHSRYQFVEDNVIEMKMARGLPTASKMSMCLEFEFMKIGVKDERCPNVLVLTMEKTRAELKTYKLSISNQPVYQGKVCTSADMGYTVAKPQPIGPVFMSPNQTKVMRIQTEKVEWVTDNRDGIAVVEGVRGTKTLQIFNETTFVDQDVMEVYVSSTRLERVSPIFLDWLLVMQDTSNRVASSRFSHKKNSTMHVSMQSYVFSTQPFHFSHRPAREIAPLVNLNPENPIDTNRLTTFSITEMNVTKVGNFESIISQYQIVMDLLVIETSIPSIELEQQYQVSLRSLDNKTSDRKKSNPADRADSFPDYMSYTGSRWTYVSFGCTFDLGVLMQFQSLTADIFAVDLVHSYHQRVAKDEVGLRSSARLRQPVVTDEALGEKDNNDQAAFLTYYNVGEHAYYEVLNVINSPFVSTSSLRTRWTGDSSDCKMGDVFVHASAGGNLKGLESFQMIKSTVDRINGRMTYMKTKAAALYRDPISEQMNSIRYKKKRRTRTRSGETVGSDSLPNNKQGPHRKNAGRSSFSKAFEDVPDVNVGAKMSNASLQEQLGALGAPVTSVTMTNLQVEFCVETPQIIGITAKKSRRRHAGVERNIDFRRKSSILLTGKNNGKPSDVPSGSLWDENVPIAKKEEPIEFHEFNNTRNELDGFAKMTLISRGFVYSSSIHGSVFNIADCSMYLNDYRDMPWLHLSGFRFSSIVQANKKTNGKSNKEKDTYPFNLSPSEKTSEYQKNETIGVPIKEIIVDMNEFVVSFAPEMNSGHFIDLMSAQLSAYGVATLPISPPAHPSDEPFSPTNDNFQESTFEVGADNASDSQNTDIERDDEDLDSTVRIGLHLGLIDPITEEEDETNSYDDNRVSIDSDDEYDTFGYDSGKEQRWSLGKRQDMNNIMSEVIEEGNWVDPAEYEEFKPQILSVNISLFLVKLDGDYEEQCIEDLMMMEMKGIDLILDSTKELPEVYDEIATYDFGPGVTKLEENPEDTAMDEAGLTKSPETHGASPDTVDFVLYHKVSGGNLRFSTASFTIRFGPIEEPYIRISDLCYTGIVYSATVNDPRVHVDTILIPLAESVPVVVQNLRHINVLNNASNAESENDEANRRHNAEDHHNIDIMLAALTQSAAPGKFYMDLSMTGKSMDIIMAPATSRLIEATSKAMEICLPPNKDPSPMLSQWDSLRYFFHGTFSFHFNGINFTQIKRDTLKQLVQIKVSMMNPKLYLDRNSVEFCALDFSVCAELFDRLHSRRKTSRNVRYTAKAGGLAHKKTYSELLRVPGFVFALYHEIDKTVEGSNAVLADPSLRASDNFYPYRIGAYNHHDVYLRPALAEATEDEYNSDDTKSSSSSGSCSDSFHSNDSDDEDKFNGFSGKEFHMTDSHSDKMRQTRENGTLCYINNDKYYYFRSRKMSEKWNIEMRCADAPDKPITINLRLDVCFRVMDAFNSSDELTEDDIALTLKKKSNYRRKNNTSNTILNSLAENVEDTIHEAATAGVAEIGKAGLGSRLGEQDFSHNIVRRPSSMQVGSIVRTLAIQFKLDKFVVSSWCAAHSLKGVVFDQQNFDLQLRMVRNVSAKAVKQEQKHQRSTEMTFRGPAADSMDTIGNEVPISISKDEFFAQSPRIPNELENSSKRELPSRLANIITDLLSEDDESEDDSQSPYLDPENDDEFQLSIDHLFVSIDFVEVYVREWDLSTCPEYLGDFFDDNHTDSNTEDIDNLKLFPRASLIEDSSFLRANKELEESSTHSHTPSALPRRFTIEGSISSSLGVEPSDLVELRKLYRAIYKLAHTTKVLISLTDDGEIAAKCSSFNATGILTGIVNNQHSKKSSIEEIFPTRYPTSAKPSVDQLPSSPAIFHNIPLGGFVIGKEWRRRLGGSVQFRPKLLKEKSLSWVSSKKHITRLRSYKAMSMSMSTSIFNIMRVKTGDNNASLQDLFEYGGGGRRKMSFISVGSFNGESTKFGRRKSSFGLENTALNSIIDRKRRSSTLKSGRHSHQHHHGHHHHQKHFWDPKIDGYRASLRSFLANHDAFTPPKNALPNSYRGARNPTKLGGLMTLGGSTLFLPKLDGTSSFPYKNSTLYSKPEEAAPALGDATGNTTATNDNKIWGVRVIDIRLLMTIQIRDTMFAYVTRTMELFGNRNRESRDSFPNEKLPQGSTKKTTNDISVDRFIHSPDAPDPNQRMHHKDFSERGTLMDFLSLNEDLSQPSPAEEISLASKFKATSNDGTNRERRQSIGQKKQLFDTIKEKSTDSVPSKFVHKPSETRYLTTNNKQYKTGGRGLSREINRRGSLRDKSIDVRNTFDEDDDLDQLSPLTWDGNKSKQPFVFKFDPVPSPLSTGTGSVASSKVPSPKRIISQNLPYFMVELIDPQINFLDDKTHSSLIIVTGRSSLEGKRYNTATMPPASTKYEDSGDTPEKSPDETSTQALVPRRKHEIRLRMDGVSAFTVPTLTDPDSEYDSVHWKHLENTFARDALKALEDDITTGDFSTDSFGISSSLGQQKDGNKSSQPSIGSTLIKTAIKDFQIRAVYIFWMELTDEQLRTMYVKKSRDELICTFKLELPDICVDIVSWQFYIVMNVVRNVLLAPPPGKKSAVQVDREDEAAENDHQSSKWVELARNPEVLAKYDMKLSSTFLDINYKQCRDEIKVLIEENFNIPLDIDVGGARFVEIFIGKCTWILRNYTSAATQTTSAPSAATATNTNAVQVSLEVGLTGIYATFQYNEDRTSTSIFEVQRLWARDFDPDGDPTLFVDQNIVMMPVLEEAEHCARCGAEYKLQENHSSACTFHADVDGEPGEYREITIIDELTGKPSTVKAWSCCNRHHKFSAGCSARPHTCKETMISVRAEAFPQTRIENVEVTVIKTLEISVFPSASYDLHLQITKSLSEGLHHYFSIDSIENNAAIAAELAEMNCPPPNETAPIDFSEQKPPHSTPVKDHKASLLSMFGSRKKSDPPTPAERANNPTEQPRNRKPTKLGNSASKRSAGKRGSFSSVDEKVALPLHQTAAARVNAIYNRLAAQAGPVRQEIVYIRYLRIGDVNVEVSTAGFSALLNLDKFKAVMEPFYCRGEALDWRRLITLIERHIVWSLTKNTAQSSISRIKRIFRMPKGNQTVEREENTNNDKETSEAKKRQQLLGI